MEDKQLKELPPSYSNLAFDSDPVAGPSAPKTESGPIPMNGATGSSNTFPQPSAPLPPPYLDAPGPGTLYHNPPSLVFENIYEACVRYADDNCCYGTRFVNQMKLTEVHNRTLYHYRLESFGERRESRDRDKPYKGGPVDGPENGRPPDLWDMTVPDPTPFKNDWTYKDIPHTESVRECPECHGYGVVRCNTCDRSGKEDCSRCRGSGKVGEDNHTCSSCSGSGKQKCSKCDGKGEVTCPKCDGYKSVTSYKLLEVIWKNHPTDSMTSTDQLPPELIPKAQGVELFRETANKLQPLRNAAESEVNSLSVLSLQAHKIAFPNEVIIKQRHILRAIPFTRVKYKWKEREGEFYIYGADEQVYFENYPQKCCCCTCC